jgi:hypothetical protein
MMQPIDDSTVIAIRSVPRSRLSTFVSAPNEVARARPPAPRHDDRRTDDRRTDVAPLGAVYTAPFGFVLHALINHAQRSVPLVVVDEHELEAIGRALELVGGDGGFEARARPIARLEARICVSGAHEADRAAARVKAMETELLELATAALPRDLELSEGLTFELLPCAEDALLIGLRCEAPDGKRVENAMHAAAQAILPVLSRLSGVDPSLRVTCTRIECTRVHCRIDARRLVDTALGSAGARVAPASVEQAIYRATAALGAGARNDALAAAHNGLIASGVAAVALAFGNAQRRVFADAERHATRAGGCQPLCTWRAVGDAVHGELELPLVITPHCRRRCPDERAHSDGTSHDPSSDAPLDISMLAACIGMASSVVALTDAVRVRVLEERRVASPPRLAWTKPAHEFQDDRGRALS